LARKPKHLEISRQMPLGLLIPGLRTTDIFGKICGELARLARIKECSPTPPDPRNQDGPFSLKTSRRSVPGKTVSVAVSSSRDAAPSHPASGWATDAGTASGSYRAGASGVDHEGGLRKRLGPVFNQAVNGK
jgi:hypothetical protein